MKAPLSFTVEATVPGTLGRAGVLQTPHGAVKTPAFVSVGTKATIKALTTEQIKELGVEMALTNTYHLYLQPGENIVAEAGGLHTFMNWNGPLMTDSGGFQVFSLGDAFGSSVTKLAFDTPQDEAIAVYDKHFSLNQARLARIDEDGVTFASHLDGSTHRLTAERSIEIQHKLGADIIIAFDECTSSAAPHEYQKEAMDRTHRWARRSLKAHRENTEAQSKQGLYGVIQGGRFNDLRQASAEFFADQPFDGYGIGGSFTKHDLDISLSLVNNILPPEKPRHLLGIGEPEDLFAGVEKGIDTFDCVSPTRLARTGTLYTQYGKLNLLNNQYVTDYSPVTDDCQCYTCLNYSKAYLAHLFRSKEMLGATLASYHNLYFIVHLVSSIRLSILNGTFKKYQEEFLNTYGKAG